MKLYYLHVCRDYCSAHLFEVLVLSDLVPHGLRGGRPDQPLPVRHLNLQTLAADILYLLRGKYFIYPPSAIIFVFSTYNHRHNRSPICLYLTSCFFFPLDLASLPRGGSERTFFLVLFPICLSRMYPQLFPPRVRGPRPGSPLGPAQRQATVNTRPSVLQQKVGLRTEINFIVMN